MQFNCKLKFALRSTEITLRSLTDNYNETGSTNQNEAEKFEFLPKIWQPAQMVFHYKSPSDTSILHLMSVHPRILMPRLIERRVMLVKLAILCQFINYFNFLKTQLTKIRDF